MQYDLPKGYLSSSACDLWERNPNDFRDKYYRGHAGFSSPYTDFGKRFADDMEHNPEKYPAVPRHAIPEFPIKWVIEGVPVLGYLDSFCPHNKSIIEYKTGILKETPTWDTLKVRKWKQLPFYAMCIRAMFGTYDPNVTLVWLKTEWAEECTEQRFGTQLIQECSPALRLADPTPEIFVREIEAWELDAMVDRLKRIATEVTEDYARFREQSA